MKNPAAMHDAGLDFPTFELSPALELRIAAAPQDRPIRRRAGPRSTNRDEASVAELTNRPTKRTRR